MPDSKTSYVAINQESGTSVVVKIGIQKHRMLLLIIQTIIYIINVIHYSKTSYVAINLL